MRIALTWKNAIFTFLVLLVLPISIAAEHCPKYDRNEYGGWIDADGDCQRTRSEVLVEESTSPVTFRSSRNCKVVSGMWSDPFSGRTFTDPKMLDIDHVVPLKEAHQSGAWKWDSDKKQRYANYLRDKNHLIAVYRSENRSKGYKDPAEWLPSNRGYQKAYARIWIAIKNRWDLTADRTELEAFKRILGDESGVVYPRQEEECTEVAGNPFATPTSVSTDPVVKKSKSGICHDQSSKWYKRTKKFVAYGSIEACLSSGGRLPR